MRKPTYKQRQRDVLRTIRLRNGKHRVRSRCYSPPINNETDIGNANDWLQEEKLEGINVHFSGKRVTLALPEKMNFSDEYEVTTKSLTAIRKLANRKAKSLNKNYLASVRFDNLNSISTSAALVLTAELSRWDDIVNQNLRPQLQTWDPVIIRRFAELGFFELFNNAPDIRADSNAGDLQLVKYIKGICGDKNKTKVLKSSIQQVIGDTISKWVFLHSGISEAITNVSHHAYPDENIDYDGNDKNWYLTGSFNKESNTLKIAFYDQGIGIPKSLPTSKVWEKVLKLLSAIPQSEQKLHTTLLKAAVQIDRTSTGANDRGKGLQDLLEFIKQRRDGYLSILSLKGLYKFSIENGKEKAKTHPFDTELPGTLIIWSVNLLENQ